MNLHFGITAVCRVETAELLLVCSIIANVEPELVHG